MRADVDKSIHQLLYQHRTAQPGVPLKAVCNLANDVFRRNYAVRKADETFVPEKVYPSMSQGEFHFYFYHMVLLRELQCREISLQEKKEEFQLRKRVLSMIIRSIIADPRWKCVSYL